MQNDLISRSALIEACRSTEIHISKHESPFSAIEHQGQKFRELVKNAPTIDAAPVVHGRWITSSDIPDTLICSVCGRRYDMYHFDQMDMPFCLCGAKMDGGAEA